MITHVPKMKMNIGERNTQDLWDLRVNITYMEVDNVDEVRSWIEIQMVESKLIAQDLVHDGIPFF
jgi:hypothetical protein